MLTQNPPYGAEVTFTNVIEGGGWNLPNYHKWLSDAIEEAALEYFGKKPLSFGEGGSIPLIGLLNQIWPQAQFIVTGVLGPASNAHGPNEFLHIEYCRKITETIAHILAKSSDVKPTA